MAPAAFPAPPWRPTHQPKRASQKDKARALSPQQVLELGVCSPFGRGGARMGAGGGVGDRPDAVATTGTPRPFFRAPIRPPFPPKRSRDHHQRQTSHETKNVKPVAPSHRETKSERILGPLCSGGINGTPGRHAGAPEAGKRRRRPVPPASDIHGLSWQLQPVGGRNPSRPPPIKSTLHYRSGGTGDAEALRGARGGGTSSEEEAEEEEEEPGVAWRSHRAGPRRHRDADSSGGLRGAHSNQKSSLEPLASHRATTSWRTR